MIVLEIEAAAPVFTNIPDNTPAVKIRMTHFSALFFGETGVSPMNYFIRLKIQKACEYIELTNMKLNEIATHLGFEDAAYFSRTFTKVMGCSPSVYRKKEMEI